MTAETTAQRVLTWAAAPAGPPPEGPLWSTRLLAAPQPATLALVCDLAAGTSARLGAGAPPFGDQSPVGAGAVLLAAAAGGRRQLGPARRLAEALPPSRPLRTRPDQACWPDLVARHGLVAAVLARWPGLAQAPSRQPQGSSPRAPSGGDIAAADPADEPLTEVLLRMSPLTTLLHRPARQRLTGGTTGDQVEAAAALLERPRGLAVLAAGLAAWPGEADILRWRAELLDRLSRSHQDLLLDTYTMARLRHGTDWDRRLQWARRMLSMPGPPDPLAIATLQFWVPLARLRQRRVPLPDARPLLVGYLPALELVRHYRLLATGAS
jgi:FtsH ternary system domain X1